MAVFHWRLGFVIPLLLNGIQVGQGCMTLTFLNQNTLRISCSIPTFSGTGSWFVDGVGPKTNCGSNTFCTTTIDGNYTFTSDPDGIYVQIDQFSSDEIGKLWKCVHPPSFECNETVTGPSDSPISQMNSSIATEGTTSVNSIFDFSNITLPMISGSRTTTSDISASNSRLLNTGTMNLHSNTETKHFYAKTETTTPYANTETADLDANTQSNEIQTNTLIIISSFLSTYQSMLVKTAVNDILGSIDSTIQIMSETFAQLGYSSPSYNKRTLPSRLETSNVFPQTVTVSSISFSMDTLSDDLFHNIHVTSGSTDSSEYSILSETISPLMSTSFIDPISYSSLIEDPSFSYHQYFSEFSVTLLAISVSSPLPLLIIDTMNYTTSTLITSYLDDTSILLEDFTNANQTFSFSQDYAASASTPFDILYSTDHPSSLQTTEYYYETMHTEFTSYVTTPLYKPRTYITDTGIYSKEKVTSGKSYIHTSVMPSQKQLSSTNGIQDSTTDFEPYSQSHNEVFSSESSDDYLSTLQSTSLLLQFNTTANILELDSYIKPTYMSTLKSQSGILTMDLSLYKNPTSIKISTILLDFKTTLHTTPSKIQSSSKQTNNGISYNEIETSFKDSLSPLHSFSGSFTSNDKDMTSLSSGVYKSISTMSTNIIQSGLSEKNKTIIFISTSSAVIAMIVVILLIIFAKVYRSKFNNIPLKVDDKTSWSNNSIPPKTAFPDYSFTGKSIYPLLNTSSSSIKMFHYEQHWNDIV